MFVITSIPFLVAIVFNIFLAFLVYRKDEKGSSEILFLLANFSASAWLVVVYLGVIFNDNLLFARFSIFFAIFFCAVLYLLANLISKDNKVLNRKHLFLVVIVTFLVMLINISPYALIYVNLIDGEKAISSGFGFLPFAFLSSFFTVATMLILIHGLWSTRGLKRIQLAFFTTGVLSMLLLVTFTVLIPVLLYNDHSLIFLTPLYVLFFLIMTAIAILKYHLFNVRLIATEILLVILFIISLIWSFFSSSSLDLIFRLLFTFFVAVVGFYIIRSVKREITHRQQITELAWSLKEANLKLRDFDKKKNEFLSIASHQLRTPLSISKGQISLLRKGVYKKSKREEEEAFEDLESSNERLIDLVDNFLNITRIEQGRINYDFQKNNLYDLLESVVGKFRSIAEDKGLDLALENKCNKNIEVFFDKEKIINVLNNLLDNAIKYSKKGKIMIKYDCDDKEVRVSVKDQGLGFFSEDKNNFFEKFYRSDNCLSIKGTGLGLYVVKTFIDSHNGKVWAKSRGLGKGSEFGFSLPLEQGK